MTTAEQRRELDVRLLGEAMISDEAPAVLRELCDTCGSRFAGSAEERRAGDFLLGKFAGYGLSGVHAETFRFTGWKRGRRPTLKAVAPRAMSFEAIALPYCPSTPKRGVELELLCLGEGLPEDFARARRQIKGKAVMVTSASPGYYHRWVHRAEKYARAVAAGARAFIFMNHDGGLLEPTGSIRFNRRAEIPGVGVSKETGQRLLRLADGEPVRIHLTTHDKSFAARGRNIVADIPGSQKPEEMVVVGAHYDGHDISQAAADNASGVAAILDTARLLAPHAGVLRRTVRFVCFSAEEVGLIGSAAYVERHIDEMPHVRLMVNCDCIGSSRGKGFDFQGWNEAKPRLAAMAAEMRESIPFASRPMPYSDHFNFMAAGVPCCNLGSIGGTPHGRGYGHTAADTLDKVSRADLREAVALLARCLIRFANDRRWALPRKTKAQVRTMLDRYELIHVMETEGTLPERLR